MKYLNFLLKLFSRKNSLIVIWCMIFPSCMQFLFSWNVLRYSITKEFIRSEAVEFWTVVVEIYIGYSAIIIITPYCVFLSNVIHHLYRFMVVPQPSRLGLKRYSCCFTVYQYDEMLVQKEQICLNKSF